MAFHALLSFGRLTDLKNPLKTSGRIIRINPSPSAINSTFVQVLNEIETAAKPEDVIHAMEIWISRHLPASHAALRYMVKKRNYSSEQEALDSIHQDLPNLFSIFRNLLSLDFDAAKAYILKH